jgi:hypothetical protein
MMKKILFSLVLVLSSKASWAGTRNCNAALVTAGLCRSTADVIYVLPISTADPDGAGPQVSPSALVVAAFTTLYGYSSPLTCTSDMVGAGLCSSGQIATQVTVTQAQFVDFQIRLMLLQVVRQYRLQQGIAAAQATAAATSDPDIGN